MVEPAPRGRNPFADEYVRRGDDGVARYTHLEPSLVAQLRTSVERSPDAPAVLEVGSEWVTYQQLWDRSARVAGGLRAHGLQRGDRAAIRLPNGIDWVYAFWGCQLAGVVVVPVNTRFSGTEVDYVVTDSGATHVFVAGEPLPDGEPFVIDDLTQDDLAAIFYTSGTTGFPKGAMTTHGNFLTNIEDVHVCLNQPREDGPTLATLISVPLFHVTGCNSGLLPMLAFGGRVAILQSALDLEGILRTIAAERITHMSSVPAIYHALLRHPLLAEVDASSLRGLSYGGAPMAATLVHELADRFPEVRLGNGFGLTETSSLTSFLPTEDAAEHADSVGYAMPVVDLALADRDPSTGVGELLVRGPNVVKGYWNKPEATADTFVDGWLHTGDLARIDADGLLYIVDRKKDMINRGGENVYSVEVENALAGAPGISEAAVIGVPDDMMGEKVGAVVVPLPGAVIDPQAVVAYARQRIADFKVPQYIAVRADPLPRNPGGKVLKAELRGETEWGAAVR